MIPGPVQIIKCPACGAHQSNKSLRSGNTFGARYFSDGKRLAPMLPEYPYFVKCHACNVYFKINDKVIVGETSREKITANGSKAPFVRFLTVNEYSQAIKEGLYNGDEKDILSLRLSMWRRYNDIYDGERRYETYSSDNKVSETEERDIYEDNCRKILSMMSENKDDESLLTFAELYRNIGDFDKCKKILNTVEKPEKYERYISKIKAECDKKNTDTIEV